MASDEHYIGTIAGVKRCRSIWRRLGKAWWTPRAIDEFVGTPWALTPAIDAMRMSQVRGVHITLDRQIKHGGTKGCPACYGHATVHSAECRARFEVLLAHDNPAAAPVEELAAWTAQARWTRVAPLRTCRGRG